MAARSGLSKTRTSLRASSSPQPSRGSDRDLEDLGNYRVPSNVERLRSAAHPSWSCGYVVPSRKDLDQRRPNAFSQLRGPPTFLKQTVQPFQLRGPLRSDL